MCYLATSASSLLPLRVVVTVVLELDRAPAGVATLLGRDLCRFDAFTGQVEEVGLCVVVDVVEELLEAALCVSSLLSFIVPRSRATTDQGTPSDHCERRKRQKHE